MPSSKWRRFVPLAAATFLVATTWTVYVHFFSQDGLVVYCAHDSVYSEAVLNRFTEQTGIPVQMKFDTEASKSLGLVEMLVEEREHPRCDVFWNNELLGMMQLSEEGILQPYKGPGYERIPDQYRDPEGRWTGFGARTRVYIANTTTFEGSANLSQAAPALLAEGDLSRVAIAKPLFGTTLTQYCAVWKTEGPDWLKEWHAATRNRGLKEVNGNSVTKDLVASGVCDLGFTDTDDYYLAVDAGQPVTMAPVRLEDGSTICIPNTVAIVAGTQRTSEAQLLVDFLLSEETELRLAKSSSRQIPLGRLTPGNEKQLPEEVRAMIPWITESVDLTKLGDARQACLAWLKSLND